MEFTSENPVVENTMPEGAKLYQVIGVNVFKFRSDSHDHGYQWMDKYTVYLSQTNNYGSNSWQTHFMFQAWTDYTDCGSGWCSATIGNCTKPTQIYEQPIGTLHFLPKSPINVYCKQCVDEDGDGITRWITENGYPMFTISSDGGDGYYPHGSVLFNSDLFTKTIRLLTIADHPTNRGTPINFFDAVGFKQPSEIMGMIAMENSGVMTNVGRQLYVFHGPSCVGKSFLGSRLHELSVYETDQEDELPDDIVDHHVIVVGNRVKDHLLKVKEALKNIDSGVEVIWMGFSRECPV